MSVIDQAFVKAYLRRTQTESSGEVAAPVSDTIASPPDVSINPRSEQSAIVWVDAVADQYLRRDQPHPNQAAAAGARATANPTAAPANAFRTLRSRGSRPPANPATPPAPAATEKTAELRQDAGHPVNGPVATPSITPPPTAVPPTAVPPTVASPIADTPATAAPPRTLPTDDLADIAFPQFATLPWIEASATLIDTPRQASTAGPYFSDTVIVQENYLPLPITAPAVPPAPAPAKAPAPIAEPDAIAARPSMAEPTVQAAPVQAAPSTPPTPLAAAPAAPATVPPPSTRSAIVAPAPPVRPFSAVWEVDAFEFSDTVIALFGDASMVRSIGVPLDRAVSEGLQTLLITSIERNAGRTTVATGIAIAAASAGLRVVLVDATMATAVSGSSAEATSLADALNLDVQYGWLEAVRGGISVAETAVHSIEDQLTVLPLVVPRAGLPPTYAEFSRLLEPLRESFDLVVIDGPPCTEATFRSLVSLPTSPSDLDSTADRPASAIDAAILVQDMRATRADQANRIMEMLRRDGITGLGIVQNFVE